MFAGSDMVANVLPEQQLDALLHLPLALEPEMALESSPPQMS